MYISGGWMPRIRLFFGTVYLHMHSRNLSDVYSSIHVVYDREYSSSISGLSRHNNRKNKRKYLHSLQIARQPKKNHCLHLFITNYMQIFYWYSAFYFTLSPSSFSSGKVLFWVHVYNVMHGSFCMFLR